MDKQLERILFEVFDLEIAAAKSQKERGGHDQGLRAGVTAGKHLDPLANYIAHELTNSGVHPNSIFTGNSKMELPGWFRPNKQWDILAFHEQSLVGAIELKSIGSSYSNNFNNRTEEALGSAADAAAAVKYNMYKAVQPPAFAYVLVVRDEQKSRTSVHTLSEPHFPVDPVFKGASYLQRFETMCSRMLREKLYDAIWLVFVDTDKRKITEPVKALSFNNFIVRLQAQVKLFA